MSHNKIFGLIAGLSLAAAVSVSGPALAHHGSNGQFDTSADMTVTGVYTHIKYVNPHGYIYFDVTSASGEIENWRCELSSGSQMKRNGWTQDLFKVGETITISGHPARAEPHGCMMQNLTFEDGRELGRTTNLNTETLQTSDEPRALTLADGTPNLFGNWMQAPRVRAAAPAGGGGAMGGGMSGPPPAFVDVTPSEAGYAANEGWVIEDLPRLSCQAVNIFHDWWFDGHVNTISQEGDDVIMTYGFMDLVRTIHMDGKAHPDNVTPSRAGHSIGRWDGDALVIETSGFEAGYILDIPGIKHSDQLTTTERLYLSEDGKTLVRDYSGQDPLYLEGTFTSRDEMVTTNSPFDSYECDDLTQEVVAGGFEYKPAAAPAMGAAGQVGSVDTASGGMSWLKILAALALAGVVGVLLMRRKKS